MPAKRRTKAQGGRLTPGLVLGLEDRTANELRPVAFSGGLWVFCGNCRTTDRLSCKVSRSGRWQCFAPGCGAGGLVDEDFVAWLADEAAALAKTGGFAGRRK